MATIIRALWLVAKRASFSCNDRELLANLIVDILMDIHVMVNWQLSKRVSADQCQKAVLRDQVHNSLRWSVVVVVFFLSAEQLLVLAYRKLRSIMRGQIINNLLTSSVLSLQGNLRPWPWCIDLAIARSMHQGLGLWFPCDDFDSWGGIAVKRFQKNNKHLRTAPLAFWIPSATMLMLGACYKKSPSTRLERSDYSWSVPNSSEALMVFKALNGLAPD